ncbi:MAG: MBL fold metallo-hydrolase [Aestuariivita sp.]|nr:MBL fold metallo-hydrolase [Aestuariivita sp.]MCY4201751.1 MBL fold metallo-hydrolase [Aestuariivita sp.]MCY4289425.1 MBL fold metallo-hydrolase [Aestuariivita sp.]MCY4346650.1 MBL fold metallo-hydrolase [Aestuariivita sp.]
MEVAQQIYWLRLPLPMKLNHVNVYLADEGDSWTIIDTGVDSQPTREIWRLLQDQFFNEKPIARVIATHHHPDHIGLAGWFQREYDCDLMTTRTAWLFARMLTLDEQETLTPENTEFYRRSGMPSAQLRRRVSERPFNFVDIVAPLPLGYTRIKEGDCIKMAGRNWDVRIGNGHAPEHLIFWSKDDNLVIAGDQVLSSISPIIGVYATEPMANPLLDWLETCKCFEALADDNQLVLAGHKLPFRGLRKRMAELLRHHQDALDRTMDFLNQPRSAVDCFSPLFERQIGESEYNLALSEAVAHLNYLFLSEQLSRELSPRGVWLYQRKD